MATHNKSKRTTKDWRKKQTNLSKLKYTKEQILSLFIICSAPSLNNLPISLQTLCQPPVLLSSPTITCENSRRKGRIDKKERKDKTEAQEKTEKQEQPKKQELKVKFKIEIIDDKPESLKVVTSNDDSKLNEYFEMRANESVEEKKEITYPDSLIRSHVEFGNPFALVIDKNCQRFEKTIIPEGKALEKLWYYKDPGLRVHGPFTSVEMFNWAAAGYFTTALMVAKEDTSQFYSLNMYINLYRS